MHSLPSRHHLASSPGPADLPPPSPPVACRCTLGFSAPSRSPRLTPPPPLPSVPTTLFFKLPFPFSSHSYFGPLSGCLPPHLEPPPTFTSGTRPFLQFPHLEWHRLPISLTKYLQGSSRFQGKGERRGLGTFPHVLPSSFPTFRHSVSQVVTRHSTESRAVADRPGPLPQKPRAWKGGQTLSKAAQEHTTLRNT